ncbi:MAG: hypothetical protein FWJ66_13300 [Caldibacillus sp.]
MTNRNLESSLSEKEVGIVASEFEKNRKVRPEPGSYGDLLVESVVIVFI